MNDPTNETTPPPAPPATLRVTDKRAERLETMANHRPKIYSHNVLDLLDDRRQMLAELARLRDEAGRMRYQVRAFRFWFNRNGSPCDGFRFQEEGKKLDELVELFGHDDPKELHFRFPYIAASKAALQPLPCSIADQTRMTVARPGEDEG
jgi:hypothetical protein